MDYGFNSLVFICLSMGKWAIRGHFYSYVKLVRLLYNIRPCCHVIAQVCILGRSPRTKETIPIFF